MTHYRSMASAFVLAVLGCACSGGDTPTSSPEPKEPETEIRSLLPDAPAESAAGDDGQGRCPAGECPAILLFGALLPGCCRGVDACGGNVQIGERSWLCVPPDYARTAQALRVALEAHEGEPLVIEPSCPSHTFDGSTLVGCCIVGGTCGVSTELWTAAAAQLGLSLPNACILASEAVEIVGAALVDAGPPPACSSPELTPTRR